MLQILQRYPVQRRSRSKIFRLFIWIKEPCVRKSEGLERSKLLGISQRKTVAKAMKIICRYLDEQHSGKKKKIQQLTFFRFGNFKNLLFLGLQKERFLLFWSAEFLLGLSLPVLVS